MLLDLLLPQRCVACRTPGAQLCAACRNALPRLCGPCCARCGAPTAWPVARCRECARRRFAFATARAAVGYDDRVRTVVTAWKERGLRGLARAAAEITVEVVPAPVAPLTPVPADPDRRLRRGYSPAPALAAELARLWDVPVLGLLERTTGRRQRGLSLEDRRQNVRNVFTANSSPRRVVLIDDVYTSGATAAAAASALRRAGAREVLVVTFARAIRGYYSEASSSTTAQGGRVATSGQGQERGGQRVDPRVRGAEAGEARPPAR